MDDTVVPEQVPDIGGKTFLWCFQNKSTFVDFCVLEMQDCTGFFKEFQEYCTEKIKNEDENSPKTNRR